MNNPSYPATVTEFVLINNAISTLAILCSAPRQKIVEWLTGKLWEEQEALWLLTKMKETDGDFYPVELKKPPREFSIFCQKCGSHDNEIHLREAGTILLTPTERPLPPLEKDTLFCRCRDCEHLWQEVPLDQRNKE